MIKLIRTSMIVLLSAGLGACKAIDLSQLKTIASTAKACEATAPGGPVPGAASLPTSHMYGPLLLPLSVSGPGPAGPGSPPLNFTGYVAKAGEALKPLPKDIREDAVTQAFFKYVVQASAAAQLSGPGPGSAGVSPTALGDWNNDVTAYPLPTKLTYSQLKHFTKKAFHYGFRPQLQPTVPGAAAGPSAFETYFRAYYEGKFVDRFGKSISKPQLPNSQSTLPISLTITDAEISAAETVLLEYLFDLLDPTPVLGDAADSSSVTANTLFYPGGTSDSKPTVFGTSLAHYMMIGTAGCGVTKENIVLLTDLSSAAGDHAAAIGGLTFNTAGGIGVSLGVFGKLSIGDNATLSTLAKDAVSRFAMRMTYASSFWILRDIGAPGGVGGPKYLAYPVDPPQGKGP